MGIGPPLEAPSSSDGDVRLVVVGASSRRKLQAGCYLCSFRVAGAADSVLHSGHIMVYALFSPSDSTSETALSVSMEGTESVPLQDKDV